MFSHLCYSVRRLPQTHKTSVRNASTTVLGASGRQYVRGEVIYKNQQGHPTIFKAANKSIFDLSRRLADEFAGARRLRMPIDFSSEDNIVVYPYFKDTLLRLIRKDPHFPPAELQKVLRCVGEGIQEFHAKGWLHLDVKPDNIFINWTFDEEGNKTVTDAALGDFGIAFDQKQIGDTPLRTGMALGNFMWRSPEQQTGSGITKASDVFSYGLVCIYALGGADLLLLEDDDALAELAKLNIPPQVDILARHFAYFGLVNEGLLKQVDSNEHEVLKKASAVAKRAVESQPELRLKVWGEELGEAALNMIAGMTKPDPMARLTIEQVLESPWWQKT